MKENGIYTKEISDLEARREKFIAENREEWDIKNVVWDLCYRDHRIAIQIQLQGKLIEESKKLVLDTSRRAQKAAAELSDFVVCRRL